MAGRRRQVRWTDEARFALDEVLSYIARESPQGARSVLERVLKTGASLATMAERGRVVPEQDDPAIREVFVGHYRLMYEVTQSEVLIVGFLHGARDFETWRQEQ